MSNSNSSDIQISISPCPNDIYCFSPWMTKKVHSSMDVRFIIKDIDQLNKSVLIEQAMISKVSFYTYLQMSHKYSMLPLGLAISDKEGPKLISKRNDSLLNPDDNVLLPGRKTTTTYLLLRYLFNHKQFLYPNLPFISTSYTASLIR